MTGNSWIDDLLASVVSAETLQDRFAGLSASAQAGLMQWIMEPLARGTKTRPTDGDTFTPRCHCGEPAHIPAMMPGYEGTGDVTDHAWLCHQHRSVLQSITGRPGSSGRPPMSLHDSKVQRYRELGARMAARRSEAPTAPSSGGIAAGMPRPGAGSPGPGIWR